MSTPIVKEGLLYTRDHLWISLADSVVTVGVTDYAQQQMNVVINIDPLWSVLDYAFSPGEAMFMIDAAIQTLSLYAPISGIVAAVNQQVQIMPAIINNDPYGEGWLIKLRLEKLYSNQASFHKATDSLMTADQYRHYIRRMQSYDGWTDTLDKALNDPRDIEEFT